MKRWPISLAAVAVALMSMVLSFSATSRVSAGAQGYTPNDAAVLTPTPVSPVFTATMEVLPDRPALLVGSLLDVGVYIDVSAGCRFPVMELQLIQNEDADPLFEYLSPSSDMVYAPVSNPYTYTLRAIRSGTASFEGEAYGERNCNDYWLWWYVRGTSEPVVVTNPLDILYLPAIEQE